MKTNSYDATIKTKNDFDHSIEFNEIMFEGRKYTLKKDPAPDKINRLTLLWKAPHNLKSQKQNDVPTSISLTDETQDFSSSTSINNLIYLNKKTNKTYKKSHQYPFVTELKNNKTLDLQSQFKNDTSKSLNSPENLPNHFASPLQVPTKDDRVDSNMHSGSQNIQIEKDESETSTCDTVELKLSSPKFMSNHYTPTALQNLHYLPNPSSSNDADTSPITHNSNPVFNNLTTTSPENTTNQTNNGVTSSLEHPRSNQISKCDRTARTRITHCQQCGVTSTTQWHRSPDKLLMLCNPCGLISANKLSAAAMRNSQLSPQSTPLSIYPVFNTQQNIQIQISQIQPPAQVDPLYNPFPPAFNSQPINRHELPVATIALDLPPALNSQIPVASIVFDPQQNHSVNQ